APIMRGIASRAGWWIIFGLLLAVPCVFTGRTLDAFESPKVALLQLGGLALLTVSLSARAALRPAGAVELAVVALVVSAIVSTVFSVSPRTSFFGAIESHAGLNTVLALAIAFAAARRFVPDLESAKRLMWA